MDDEHSDLDFVGVTELPDHRAAVAEWKALLSSVVTVVAWNERQQGATLLNAITDQWLRCDLSIGPPVMFMHQAKDLLRPIHDPQDLFTALPDTRRDAPLNVRQLEQLISEFIRVLGLTTVVEPRGEYVVGVSGVGMMRDLLRELMLIETPQAYRGGALHLTRLLSDEDLSQLQSLPYPGPHRDAVLAAHLEIASAFLPRARQLAATYRAAWPTAFENATKRALAEQYGDLFEDV